MKKIKSVRLKREYRDTSHVLFANQYATKIPDCKGGAFWEFKTVEDCQYSFSEQTIRNNYTDLFEIEYEQERKYIDVRIEFENGIKLYGNDFSAKGLESYLTNSYTNSNTNKGQVKVTELPELFTRRDICEIFRGCFATQDYILTLINNFLERSSK